VVEIVRVAVPALVPVMFTGLVEPKLKVGGYCASAGLAVTEAVRVTLPVNPFAGDTVILVVFPVVAPLVTVTAVPLRVNLGGRFMVYVAPATALEVYPGAVAMASIVTDNATLIAPLYTDELAVGALPSVV